MRNSGVKNQINESHVWKSHIKVSQKIGIWNIKTQNLSNYQRPDCSIYQAPVL